MVQLKLSPDEDIDNYPLSEQPTVKSQMWPDADSSFASEQFMTQCWISVPMAKSTARILAPASGTLPLILDKPFANALIRTRGQWNRRGQPWKLKKADSICKIINPESGTALDLSAGDNTSIIGWTSHDGDNQKWHVIQVEDGLYILRSVRSMKYVGLANSHLTADVRIVAVDYPFKWEIQPDEEDHTVYRFLVPGTSLYLDLTGSDVAVHDKCGGTNQCWKLKKVEPVYKIINAKSNTVLDLSAGDNMSLIGWNSHSGNNQKWHITQIGDHYLLRSVSTVKCIGLANSDLANDVRAIAVDSEFMWNIQPDDEDNTVYRIFVPGTPFNLSLASCTVAIFRQMNDLTQCWKFEIAGSVDVPITTMAQRKDRDRSWRLKKVDSIYKITNAKSGTVLDLSGADDMTSTL